MAEGKISLIDRLEERGMIDRWGFMLFAFIGSAWIVASKYMDIQTGFVALGAIAALIAYAVIINLRGSGKLRSDQAGDNCYYLGLIYTLSSLAFAIFTFDPADTATTIVQGFGIALATTIVGLVLRVFFSQSRVDLYEAEETARLELTQAAAKLKTQLTRLASDFSNFSLGLQQSVAEVRDAAQANIQETTEAAIGSVQALTTAAATAIQNQSTELSKQVDVLAGSVGTVSTALDGHAKSFSGLAEINNAMGVGVEKLAEATSAMAENSATILEQSRQTTAIQSGARELVDQTHSAASLLQTSVQATATNVEKFQSQMAARLEALEQAPKAQLDSALSAIARAAKRLEDSIDQLATINEAALSALSDKTASLVGTVEQHNAGLETELRKSREHVSKVHDALVDMTGALVQQIDARAVT